MTWRELSVDSLLTLREPVLIDVRSPCEFAAECIPGAHNVPLLSDDERAIVGTAFKEKGEVTARRLALALISPKIPGLVDRILSLQAAGNALVIHCWRGGLRSEAVASFLTVVGVDCWRLTGGYKAWRRRVLNDFALDEYGLTPVVLHGRTGVGKTEILHELQRLEMNVLDLEALCCHRGSVFGALGLDKQPTQKNFEGMLWQTVRSCQGCPIFLEAESRKVGRLSLPDFLLRHIENGRRILITGSREVRVARLAKDYAAMGFMTTDGLRSQMTMEAMQAALLSLESLTERLGKEMIANLRALASEGKLSEIIENLLIHYYDPLYDRHIARCEPYELTVSGDNCQQAARQIVSWWQASHQAPICLNR